MNLRDLGARFELSLGRIWAAQTKILANAPGIKKGFLKDDADLATDVFP